MPPGGARVFLVNLPVGDPVKRHGRGPCAHHGEKNEHNNSAARHTSCRHDHRSRGKWQRENRMRKSNEFQNSLEVIEHDLGKTNIHQPAQMQSGENAENAGNGERGEVVGMLLPSHHSRRSHLSFVARCSAGGTTGLKGP